MQGIPTIQTGQSIAIYAGCVPNLTLVPGPMLAQLCRVTEAAELAPAAPHERIISAARELFCRHGIHATGIDRILAAAGASKMTLYSRFGSKEALIREVLAREGADWRAAFFATIAAADTPMDSLRACVPALGQWYRSGRFFGCAFMNAIAEHDKAEHWLREIAADHHAQVLAVLGRLAGEAGLAEPEIVAKQVLLLIDGATAALLVTDDADVLAIAGRNLAAVLAMAPLSYGAGDAAIKRSIGSHS